MQLPLQGLELLLVGAELFLVLVRNILGKEEGNLLLYGPVDIFQYTFFNFKYGHEQG